MTNPKAEEKLARARAFIRTKAPYIMSTVYALVPIWVPGIRTLGVTEAMVLAIDDEWFAGIEDKHAAAALVHECFHIVNDHVPRILLMPNKELANIAADLVINPWLRAAGWELPHGVFPEMFGFKEGLMMEEYYKLLEQKAQQQQKQQGGGAGQKQQQQSSGKGQKPDPNAAPGAPDGQKDDGQGQKGQGQGGGKGQQQQGQIQPPGQGQGGGQGQQPSSGQGGGQGQQQGPAQGQGGGHSHLPPGVEPGVGAGRCGGVGGHSVSKELEKTLNAEHGRSEADQKRVMKQALEDIKQHAQANGRGSVPAGLLQGLENQKDESLVRWQDHLRHVLKKCTGMIEAGGMDYSLARPAKRSYARGFPRPGMVQYQPEVAVALDTSASMGRDQLVESLNETIAVMQTLGIEHIQFLQADMGVSMEPKRIRVKDLLGNVKIHGRGGTNFDPALRRVEKIRPKPDLLVYFTDGDGHVTYRPKGVQVIWAIVRSHWNRKPPCDWGHVVVIADEQKAKGRSAIHVPRAS